MDAKLFCEAFQENTAVHDAVMQRLDTQDDILNKKLDAAVRCVENSALPSLVMPRNGRRGEVSSMTDTGTLLDVLRAGRTITCGWMRLGASGQKPVAKGSYS